MAPSCTTRSRCSRRTPDSRGKASPALLHPHATTVLVDTHVIHKHLLGEHRGDVRTPGPGAADRHIQQQEERILEHPGSALRHVRRGYGVVLMTVDEELDAVL